VGRQTNEARLDNVLTAALKIAVRSGAGAVTLSKVAAESGVAKALVRYHYPKPEDMLVALAERWAATGAETTLQYLATRSGDAEDRIAQTAEAVFEWMDKFELVSRFMPTLFQAGQSSQRLFKIQRATLEAGRERIEGLLLESPRHKKMTPARRKLLARSLHSAVIGAALYVIAMNEFKNIAPYRESCLASIRSLLDGSAS
jgi:AcrR family transcriptional regulator